MLRKWWAPNNASKLQMGFNSGLKGLIKGSVRYLFWPRGAVQTVMKLFGPNYLIKGSVRYLFWPRGAVQNCWCAGWAPWTEKFWEPLVEVIVRLLELCKSSRKLNGRLSHCIVWVVLFESLYCLSHCIAYISDSQPGVQTRTFRGMRKKKLIMAGKMPHTSTYKFEITVTVLITNIL